MATAFEMDTGPDDMAEASAVARPNPEQTLAAFMASPNLAEEIVEDELAKLAHRVVSEYKIDKESRKEWEERTKQAMELAMLILARNAVSAATVVTLGLRLATSSAL